MQKIVGALPPDMHRRYRKPDASNIPAMSSSAAAQRSRLVGSHADSEHLEHLAASHLAKLSQIDGFARSDSKADAPGLAYFSVAPMQKPPPVRAGVSGLGSLTITYFHTGIRTIIGVESFHGPVR
ncbi:hypothetical protein KDX16_33310, partial [Burkholderia vietnamiensis]|uniref:hypothetical protein n=1 Tax=Burkholderia vietnamiensis TaxID=60552 RepID=UPI001B93CEE5